MNPDVNLYNQPGPRGLGQQKPPQEMRPLTRDELDTFRNCTKSGLVKMGIPFAAVMHVVTSTTKKGKTFSPTRKIGLFFANCFCGWIMYFPYCLAELRKKVMENDEKFKRQPNELADSKESTTSPQTDLSSIRSNLDTNYDGSFSHLNLDYAQSMDDLPLPDFDNKEKEKLDVTYDDLRKKNRSNFVRNPTFFGVKPDPSKEPPKQTIEPTEHKTKNKYGDDME